LLHKFLSENKQNNELEEKQTKYPDKTSGHFFSEAQISEV